MIRVHLIEPHALDLLHDHARVLRHAHDVARRAGKVALHHQQLFKRPTRAQRFPYGITPHQQVFGRFVFPLARKRFLAHPSLRIDRRPTGRAVVALRRARPAGRAAIRTLAVVIAVVSAAFLAA